MSADAASLDYIRRTSSSDERRVLLRRLATCDADFQDGHAHAWTRALSQIGELLAHHHLVRRIAAPLAAQSWSADTPAGEDLLTWISYTLSHTRADGARGAPALRTDPARVGHGLATRLGDWRLESHSRPDLIADMERSRAVLTTVHGALLRPLYAYLVAPVHAVQDADAAVGTAPATSHVTQHVYGDHNLLAGGDVSARQLLVGTGPQVIGRYVPQTETARRIHAWGDDAPDLPPAARQHIEALARAVDAGDLTQPERLVAGTREVVKSSPVVAERVRATLAWLKTEGPAAVAKGALGAAGKAAAAHAPALLDRLHHLIALALL